MRKLTAVRVILCSGLLMVAAGCFSQKAPGSDSKTEQILAQLKEIKDLLKGASKASGDEVLLADRQEPVLGKNDAPVTVVEFSDYQCPYCRKFHDETLPKLKAQYIDTGKVRLIMRDLPLSVHEFAKPAAIATRCAQQQGQFWPVFERLFRNKTLNQGIITQALQESSIDMAAYERCRVDPKITAGVDEDLADAERLGVDGTPGFVVATRKHGLLAGQLLLGAQPIDEFKAVIDPLLAKVKH
jgi:protein-disulfide isomerase